MRTIAVVNQKGGCGKTVTAINLSAFLAHENRRVLLVDIDPQGHATLGLLTDSVWPSQTISPLFLGDPRASRLPLTEIVRQVRKNLDLVPCDVRLSGAPEALAGTEGRENILSDALLAVRDAYDYVIIDCPPNVGLLTFNALKASSEAIVPMDPSFFSLHGIGKLLETIDLLARETGHRIAARVVVTLYSGRSPFVKAVLDEIHGHLPDQHFRTTIRYSIKLGEAASHGLPIVDYCRHCAGFDDYGALAAEVIEQESALPLREAEVPDRTGTSPIVGQTPAAPTLTPDGVVFTVEAPEAERVQLTGDFNSWAVEGAEMESLGRVWRKLVKLPPGRYCYRYVVDGRWTSDPLNAAVEPSPFGGHNSVLVLTETSSN